MEIQITENQKNNLFSEVRYIDTDVSQGYNDVVRKKNWQDVYNQEPIKNDDRIRVFHGCDLKTAVQFAKEGLSGKQWQPRKFSYESGMNPIGLFVSTSFNKVKQFSNPFNGGKEKNASVIIEFTAKASDLDTPVWNGQDSYFGQNTNPQPFQNKEDRNKQKEHYNDFASKDEHEYVRNSDNKAMAYNIFNNVEHQALFIGNLNPNMIKRFWVKPSKKEGYYWLDDSKEYIPLKRNEFLKQYGDTEFYVDRDRDYKEIYSKFRSQKIYKPNDDFISIEDLAKRMVDKWALGNKFVEKKKAEGKYNYEKEIQDKIEDIKQIFEWGEYDYLKELLWPKQLIQLMGKEEYEKHYDRFGIGTSNLNETTDLFPNTKVRNEDGSLKPMYRGDDNDIETFDRSHSASSNLYGTGFYFTDDEHQASVYGRTTKYYLNIEKPLSTDKLTITPKMVLKFLKAIDKNEDYGLYNYGYGSTPQNVLTKVYSTDSSDFSIIQDINACCIGDMVEATLLFNKLNKTTFDGFILSTETVVFDNSQIMKANDLNENVEDDEYMIGSEGQKGDRNMNYSHVMLKETLNKLLCEWGRNSVPDISQIGEFVYDMDFDEDEYQEYLQEWELQDTLEEKIKYIKENVYFNFEFLDNVYHHTLSYAELSYDDIENIDEVGEELAKVVLKDCLEDGNGRIEKILLFNDDINIDDPKELNAAALKILPHGGYFKGCRGFILTDGNIVYTEAEHNHCSEIPGIKGTVDFIKRGNIRILTDSMDVWTKPTVQQRRVIANIVRYYRNETLIVSVKRNGAEEYRQFDNPNAELILKYIDSVYGMNENKINKKLVISESQKNRIFLSEENTIPQTCEEYNQLAKQYFGTTRSFMACGYLLIDGSLLDFSGYKFGSGDKTNRYLDHREIYRMGWSKDGNTKLFDIDMNSFINMGNIRMKATSPGFDLSKEPTQSQYAVLSLFISKFRNYDNDGYLFIDISKENGDPLYCVIYIKPNAQRVIGDLKKYFEKGIVPEGDEQDEYHPTLGFE